MIIYINDIGKTHVQEMGRVIIVMETEHHSFYYAVTNSWLRIGIHCRMLSSSERIM